VAQRATNLMPAVWVPISTNVAPTNGIFQVIDNFGDLGVTPTNAFYQLLAP